MEIFYRGFRFVRRYLFTNPKYVFAYLLIFWQRDFSFQTHLLSEQEFIAELKNGKSLIRFGDGEINLMLGLSNYYQNYSPVLKRDMYNIVNLYNSKSPYILAIPKFVNCPNSELKSIGKLYVWLPFKTMFWLYFNKKTSYLDAHSFYYDGFFERTVGLSIINKHVVLITNQQTIFKLKANPNIPWSKVSYVCVPDKEALSLYESIKIKIEEIVILSKSEEVVLLFAMGPVGKKIALEFSQSNIQSIDIGKVAEVIYSGESIAHIV